MLTPFPFQLGKKFVPNKSSFIAITNGNQTLNSTKDDVEVMLRTAVRTL